MVVFLYKLYKQFAKMKDLYKLDKLQMFYIWHVMCN